MEQLLQRAKVAHENPKFRIADFEPLIAELRAAAEQQTENAEQAAADSVDFGLGQSDRDEAAANADRAKRNVAALSAAADALAAKRQERQESDKAKAADAERKAAIAERDELAGRFGTEIRPAIATMTDLFPLILANERRLKRAGLKEPNAEAKARGVKGGGYGVDWFTELKIPAWSGKGRLWPPKSGNPDPTRASIVASHRSITAARAEDVESRFGRYRVMAEDVFGGAHFSARVSPDSQAEKPVTTYVEPWEGQISHSEAARLKKLGVIVERLDEDVTA